MEFLIVFIFISLLILSSILFYHKTLKPTWKWFDKCDAFEKDLKENDDKERHIKILYELKKFSWHRNTGQRIVQLAKMVEMKYDVKILKNN